METELAGKVVIVTGASGGIGSAIARRFVGEGAKLVLHYRRRRAQAEALQHDLAEADVLVAGADLTREAGARRLMNMAVKRFGRVDTLIANAGSWEARDIPLHQMSLRQWHATLEAVLTSTFLSVREFFKCVARQRRGNAVLIASTAAVFGEAGHADYASAKAAMAYGLTRTLKNEIARLAPHTKDYCGGRVNCICPGWTLIPRTAGKLKNAATVRKITATMALPQVARPDDIANLAVFLSSDKLARHITGQTILAAGGMEGRWLWQPGEVNPDIV
ncbi:MAG TPA: SDR family NAD(P)-dependent oxidoreductase [Verrucomicrobiae bacterium]|nr:SDR family NAD(P)-dependent oxidoreductase [Verrucomicrobiae bacterium]